MHTILVPVDGSDHSLKALHIACDLAAKYQARIALLHVLTPRKKAAELLALAIAARFPPRLRTMLETMAKKQPRDDVDVRLLQMVGKTVLDIARARVERLGLEAEILPLATGDPAENILTAYKVVKASTIVMGSRGISSLPGASMGSVSAKVFQKADCTCISVK